MNHQKKVLSDKKSDTFFRAPYVGVPSLTKISPQQLAGDNMIK